MKKIIQWHENFYPVEGGGPAHIRNLIYNINKNYQHEIITDSVENYPRVETLSKYAVIRRFPYISFFTDTKFIKTRVISYPVRLINDLRCIHTKFEYLKKNMFDVLHIHGVVFYNAILKLNHIAKKNIYQRIVNFSFIKKPKLLTLHNFFPGFTNDTIIIDAYNHYIDQFDNIICVDRHIYDYCIRYCMEKGYSKKVWFIPNSIDSKVFFYTPPRQTGKLKVGFVGRLAGTVDLQMINQFISRLPKEMEFYMAVTGNISVVKIPKCVSDRVKIFTDVPQLKMPGFYYSIDVLFNPVLHKGVTRVTLESMACGRPVIMYKIGNKFPLINGQTGYMVNRNLDDIMNILKYCHNHPRKLKQLGLDAKKIVTKEFSNDIILPQIKTIYNHLLGRNCAES